MTLPSLNHYPTAMFLDVKMIVTHMVFALIRDVYVIPDILGRHVRYIHVLTTVALMGCATEVFASAALVSLARVVSGQMLWL